MKKNNLFILAASFLMIAALWARMISGATSLSFFPVLAVLIIAGLIEVPNAKGALMSAINITELAAKLGAYFRKNMPILVSEMLLGMNIDDRFQIMDDISDELPLPNMSISDLVKPANDLLFQPQDNAINVGARILKVRNWKVDLLIVPTVLEKTWLGAMKQKGSDPLKPMAFESFIFNYVVAKLHENIRLQALYKGVYNAAGATPVAIFDGVITKLAAEILAGNINPVVTGAITEANVVDKLLLVYDALGEAYKSVPTIMPVAPTIFDWYSRKFMPVLNSALVATDSAAALASPLMNRMPISGTNAVLLREPGLAGSQRLHCTPVENIVYGTDSLGDSNNIRIQEFERTLKLMIDGKGGVEFKEIHSRALAVNDQA